MAMGKTAQTTTSEVASHCKSLEVSPSKTSPSSPIYHGGSKAVGHGVKHTTSSEFGGRTSRPNPRGGSKPAGKKNLMAQKSHGR